MQDSNYGKQIINEMAEWFNHMKGDANIRMQVEHYKAFDEVIKKAGELINALKKMRDLYNKDGFLPLYYINSEYEDMLTMLEFIEGEVLMFGKPMRVEKNYIEYSEEEIEEIKNDPMSLELSCLEKWVEEKLI